MATAKLDIDVDFHWYNNAIDSGAVSTPTPPYPKYFVWELMIMNPVEEDYFIVLKDAWVSTL